MYIPSSRVRIPIEKGIKQVDIGSPKLFTACLAEVMRDINWFGGIWITGEFLNHLRFADDLILLAENVEQLQNMLRELSYKGSKIGLKIERSKLNA